LAAKLNSPVGDIEKKLDTLLSQNRELGRALKIAGQSEATRRAEELLSKVEVLNAVPAIIAHLGNADGDALQTVADALKGRFRGVAVLAAAAASGSVALVAVVTPDFVDRVQAGKLIQQIAPIVGGKGGGKPDSARGGGKDPAKIDEALAHARELLQ
jgi:alanyl-tRNA synthetase